MTPETARSWVAWSFRERRRLATRKLVAWLSKRGVSGVVVVADEAC